MTDGKRHDSAQLMERVCAAVADRFTASVVHIRLSYAAAGTARRSRLMGFGEDGIAVRCAPLTASEEQLLTALRASAYEPGRGTWWSMRLELRSDGNFTARFNFDNRPDFGIDLVESQDYADDDLRFPRDAGHRPAWYESEIARACRKDPERAP